MKLMDFGVMKRSGTVSHRKLGGNIAELNAYGIDGLANYKNNYRESTGVIGDRKVIKNRPLA